jgi:carbamoyltransferase
MNVIGFSGLHQSVSYKRRVFPGLTEREYRVAQGFDSAAALVTGNGIVAAAAEERFSREKTTGLFPLQAIRYCLQEGRIKPGDVDFVAHGFSYEPFKNSFAETDYGRDQYAQVFSPDVQKRNLEEFFPGSGWEGKLVPVNHHLAHIASAFYPSGFSEALVLVSDGMGEIHSMTVAVAKKDTVEMLAQVPALHSLGILYGVFTLYLGFWFGVDEYKVMGLAPYGNPRHFYDQMSDLVRLRDDGTYTIPLLASNATQLEKETHRGVLEELANRFGPARDPGADYTQRHKDIAAALQAVVQNCQLHVLRHFRRETGLQNLCLAGGVALNCSANGVIKRSRLFKQVFVQPASGDDGTALGAALYVHRNAATVEEPKRMKAPLWGPRFDSEEIRSMLEARGDTHCEIVEDFADLCRRVSERLVRGEIVGWFQGRMEYGPRALGSRSILADPRDPHMRDKINALVKKREAFRPFAPIVTKEAASTYFEIVPGEEDTYAHMLLVTPVRPSYRDQLPAITHIDGSARVQTVSRENYPRLWELLRSFERAAGLPVLLNTSFNVKGQPIVCTPNEALDTFLFAKLDLLVMGNFMITAKAGDAGDSARNAATERITIGVG